MSDRCSGEIDPFSDSSVLVADQYEMFSFGWLGWLCPGSRIPPSACGGMVVGLLLFPLRCGLTIGD